MPMYEYRCEACDEKFEAIVRVTERDNVKCPECGKKAVKKVSTFSFGGDGGSLTGYSGGGGCHGGG